MTRGPVCRFCDVPLELTVVDLGMSPPCQSVVAPDQLDEMERFYPLHARACTKCWLVQIPELVAPEEIFSEYAYFSGYATSWVEHARRYVEMIRQRLRARLGRPRRRARVERRVSTAALRRGRASRCSGSIRRRTSLRPRRSGAFQRWSTFFGRELATRLAAERRASLVVGNNVLAQVPDLNDFVAGVAILLARDGTATFEFPHLLHLLDRVEYDTIYHEHFSYFSFSTIARDPSRARPSPSTTSRSSRRTGDRFGCTRSTRQDHTPSPTQSR